jgi:hypothetical protein
VAIYAIASSNWVYNFGDNFSEFWSIILVKILRILVHYYGEHWKIGDFGCIIMMTILVKFDDFF